VFVFAVNEAKAYGVFLAAIDDRDFKVAKVQVWREGLQSSHSLHHQQKQNKILLKFKEIRN